MKLWFKKMICRHFGHKHINNKCIRCGHVMPSRAEILKLLLPGLNELFGLEYKKFEGKDE